MVEISKHMFDKICRDVDCSAIVHPWSKNCWISSVDIYKNSFLGSAKFYLLIHLAQNLLKGKKMFRGEHLMRAGEYYVRSAIVGGLVGGTSVTFICLLRWLMGGKFNYYTYIFIPNFITGLFIAIEPPVRRGLIVNLFCNMVIEYWMRSLERAGYITITNVSTTLLFMFGSSLLLYLMRLEGEKTKRTPLFWLFTPEGVRQRTDAAERVCPHDGPCLRYILKGTAAYFGVGLAFSSSKLLLPLIQSPTATLAKLSKKNVQLAMFFVSYVGIYRAIVCYLCGKLGYDSAWFGLPAGYLAGMSLFFKPNLGFAVASLSGSLKLSLTFLYERNMISDNVNTCASVVLYCVCQATLFHARYMHPDVCPSYVFDLMRSVTNRRSDQAYSNFVELFKIVA